MWKILYAFAILFLGFMSYLFFKHDMNMIGVISSIVAFSNIFVLWELAIEVKEGVPVYKDRRREYFKTVEPKTKTTKVKQLNT